MRRVELMIQLVRSDTNNTDWDSGSGIQQSEFVRHLNEAQKQLYALIVQEHPSTFLVEKYFDVNAGQEAYPTPSDAYMGQQIKTMEYSPDGSLTSFRPVALGVLKERNTTPGYPRRYIPRGSTFLLNPVPQGFVAQGLRINYNAKLPDLGIRSGTVASSVINAGAKTVTSITLANDAVLDPTGFANDTDYVSIVDSNGQFMMNAPRITGWNPATFTLSVDPSYVYQTGETIPVGAYVVKGQNTTTNSSLIDLAEDYLLKSCAVQILKRDSNVDSQEYLQDLKNKSETIISAYRDLTPDFEGIPVISTEFGFNDMDGPGW